MKVVATFVLYCFVLSLSGSFLTIQAYVEDPEIAASIAEGERLLAEIHQLMSGSSELSSAAKRRFEAALNGLTGGSAILQDFPNVVNSLFSSASDILSGGFRSFGIQSSDPGTTASPTCPDERRCCKVAIPPVTRSSSHRRSYQCLEYYRSRYTTSCGLFGWDRCTRHRTLRRYKTCYTSDVTYNSVAQSCPANYYTCCKGFFLHRNCCVNIAQLREILANARG